VPGKNEAVVYWGFCQNRGARSKGVRQPAAEKALYSTIQFGERSIYPEELVKKRGLLLQKFLKEALITNLVEERKGEGPCGTIRILVRRLRRL